MFLQDSLGLFERGVGRDALVDGVGVPFDLGERLILGILQFRSGRRCTIDRSWDFAKTTLAAWPAAPRAEKMAESVVNGRLRRRRCKTCS